MMFRQIKNCQKVTKKYLVTIDSKPNKSVINNLILNGYIKHCKNLNNRQLQVFLKYDKHSNSSIKEISNVSDSHRRKFFKKKHVRNQFNNFSYLLFKHGSESSCLAIIR